MLTKYLKLPTQQIVKINIDKFMFAFLENINPPLYCKDWNHTITYKNALIDINNNANFPNINIWSLLTHLFDKDQMTKQYNIVKQFPIIFTHLESCRLDICNNMFRYIQTNPHQIEWMDTWFETTYLKSYDIILTNEILSIFNDFFDRLKDQLNELNNNKTLLLSLIDELMITKLEEEIELQQEKWSLSLECDMYKNAFVKYKLYQSY